MGTELLLILVKDASISGSDLLADHWGSASGSWGDLLADQGVICGPFMIRVHFKMLSEISGQNF